ncbi:MAG: hypothetical protein WCV59_01355 [Parcubacteria group bacterium]|jgi:hypothetical protein
MKLLKEAPFEIVFGTKEGEEKDVHSNLSAWLIMTTLSSGKPIVRVNYAIDSGKMVGEHYEKSEGWNVMSLEEVERFVKKLEEFIEKGKEFLREHKQK